MKKVLSFIPLVAVLVLIGCSPQEEKLNTDSDLLGELYSILVDKGYDVNLIDNKISINTGSIESTNQFLEDISRLELNNEQILGVKRHLEKGMGENGRVENCDEPFGGLVIDVIYFDDGEICMFFIDFCDETSIMICG